MATLSSARKLYAGASFMAVALAAAFLLPDASYSAEEGSLLAGRVTAATGEPLAGIPVKAHRLNSNITVAVYTDAKGEYSFPSWSDVTPGSYEVKIELPDFQHVKKEGVDIAPGRTAQVDFTLVSKPLAYSDATASEIIAALPGTDHQKVLFSQCSNCHSLQWVLRAPHTKEEWAQIVKRMGGRASEQHTPGTYAFSQQQFIEPLAEYLASIRGPGSTSIPFKARPRPTDEASTKLVVTEYDLPRGGAREVYMMRGDPRFVWPHDVAVDKDYAYYTDHFSYVLGRMDRKTGKVEELPFPLPPGAGRDEGGGDGRPGNPGGGAHEIQIDRQGNVLIGMGDGLVKFNPKTQQFMRWRRGDSMFGLDPDGNVWTFPANGELTKIDTSSEAIQPVVYPIPKNAGIYDMDTDSKGRTILNIWREGKIGVFDPKTEDYKTYQLPTAMSGPRRGQIDDQNRLWVAQFYAGQVAMFDADTGEMKEYPLINGAKPFTAPYPEPYATSVDNKNGFVWTNDFSSSRIYRLDIATGRMTEYMTPSNYEIRYFHVEQDAERPTVWIPAYRPPSKLVKVQVRD